MVGHKKVKVKGWYSSSSWESHLRAAGRHLPYGITQCYLPPDISERAPSTRFTYPRGMEVWVDLVDLIMPRSGVEPATFRSQFRRRTRCTTKITVCVPCVCVCSRRSSWLVRSAVMCGCVIVKLRRRLRRWRVYSTPILDRSTSSRETRSFSRTFCRSETGPSEWAFTSYTFSRHAHSVYLKVKFVIKPLNEWVVLLPARHITGHFGDESSLQAISCTGTDNSKQTRQNTQNTK